MKGLRKGPVKATDWRKTTGDIGAGKREGGKKRC